MDKVGWQERGDLLWYWTHLLRHFFMPPARFKIGFVKNCRVDADRFRSFVADLFCKKQKTCQFLFLVATNSK
jgi:hypothetical protein